MNVFDQSAVERAVMDMVLDSGATDTVYPNRPKAAATKNDFAVVSVSGSIVDMIAYGECYVRIALFAKDTANIKNSAKLTYMYETLLDEFDLEFEGIILEGTPTIVADVADDYGYHARILNVKTIIKVTD